MSLYIPSYEEKEANKKERVEIIDTIMNIQRIESLHSILCIAKTCKEKESAEHPMELNEFVDMLDLPMAIRLMDLFKNEESRYIANSQIKELIADSIASYTGGEGGGDYV